MSLCCQTSCQILVFTVLVYSVSCLAEQKSAGLTEIEKSDSLSERPEGPLTERWAVQGGEVILPCDVTPPFPEDSPILVIISKGETVIYSIDARNGGPFKSGRKWSAPRIMDSRGEFVMDDGGGLKIRFVKKKDQSDYHCRVEFIESPTRNSRIRLHLIVSPSKPVILDSDKKEVRGVIGPYTLGDTITLHCSVRGGYPKPRITWWHDGYLLDDNSEVKDEDTTVNSIVLLDLTRQHLDRKLTCHAENSNLTKPILTSVTLNMSFPPASVDIIGVEAPLSEGEEYTFTCQSSGSRPAATLVWTIDDIVVNNSVREIILDDQTQSTLRFKPTKGDNGRALVCKGYNSQLPRKIKEDTRILNVQYPPQLSLSLGKNLKIGNIKEDDDVYFECSVKGNPEVKSVQWYHNGTLMKDDKVNGKILSFKNLVLQKISRKSSGVYTCGASNSQGIARSNSHSLNVHYAPVCSKQQQSVYGSGRKEIINITCSVESYPLPTFFKWALNTSTTDLLDVPRSHTRNIEYSSILTYTPHTPLDYGSLLCWAQNNVGMQKEPCVFQVVPAAVPEPVGNCTSWPNSSASGEVVLKCTPGWNGGLEQTFNLKVILKDTKEKVASLRHNKPHFNVKGLKPGEEYLLEVTAVNSQGGAPPVTILHLTPIDIAEKRLSKTPADGNGFGLQTLVAVLVGVMSVLFLCCIMAVITIKVRGAAARRQRPNSSTELRNSHETVEDVDTVKQDEDPDVILVSSGFQEARAKFNRVLHNTDKSYPLSVVPETRSLGGCSPSPLANYNLGLKDHPPTTGNSAGSQPQGYYPTYNTVNNRTSYQPYHKHFPQNIIDSNISYQQTHASNSSLTLPSKKRYSERVNSPEFSNILELRNGEPINVNMLGYNDPLDLKNTVPVNERKGDLHSGYMNKLGLNSSRAVAVNDCSGKLPDKSNKDDRNSDSPQRESVV